MQLIENFLALQRVAENALELDAPVIGGFAVDGDVAALVGLDPRQAVVAAAKQHERLVGMSTAAFKVSVEIDLGGGGGVLL